MQNVHEQLKKLAEKHALTSEEKHRMRSIVHAHMRAHKQVASAVRSPYVTSAFITRILIVPALCAVLIFGGVTYAAAGALPGDLLYGFRIHVNETMRVTLAPSALEKAQVEAEIAQQRVFEARDLDARGVLDPKLAQELEDNFNTHAKAALEFANVVDTRTAPPSDETHAQAPLATSSELTLPIQDSGESRDENTKRGRSSRDTFSKKIKNSLAAQSQFFDAFRVSFAAKNKPVMTASEQHDSSVAKVEESETDSTQLKKVGPSKKFMNATIRGTITPPPAESEHTSSTHGASTTPAMSTTTPTTSSSATTTVVDEKADHRSSSEEDHH